MPIYEYRCRACSHEFETMQKISARPLRKCPECGGRVDKLISRTSFQLKGAGWFAQDYGSAPTSDKAKAKKKKKAKTSESKTGAKSKTKNVKS